MSLDLAHLCSAVSRPELRAASSGWLKEAAHWQSIGQCANWDSFGDVRVCLCMCLQGIRHTSKVTYSEMSVSHGYSSSLTISETQCRFCLEINYSLSILRNWAKKKLFLCMFSAVILNHTYSTTSVILVSVSDVRKESCHLHADDSLYKYYSSCWMYSSTHSTTVG